MTYVCLLANGYGFWSKLFKIERKKYTTIAKVIYMQVTETMHNDWLLQLHIYIKMAAIYIRLFVRFWHVLKYMQILTIWFIFILVFHEIEFNLYSDVGFVPHTEQSIHTLSLSHIWNGSLTKEWSKWKKKKKWNEKTFN